MTKHLFKPLALGAAFTFSLSSGALAEISALQVWESWKSIAETFGQTLDVGSQEARGDTLILRDISLSMDMPDGSLSGSLEFMEFRERGDGTVAITMASDYPFSITANPAEGEAVDIAMIFRQKGLSIIASGDQDDISFSYLASEISVSIDKFIADGKDLDADISLELSGVNGDASSTTSGSTTFSSDFAADTLNYNINFTDPDKGGKIDISGAIEAIQSSSATTIPADFDLEDPSTLFSGDFNTRANISAGPSSTSAVFEDGSDDFSLTTNSDGTTFEFALQDGALLYGGAVNGVNYSLKAAKIPFPEISFGLGEIAFKILMPLAKSDGPQDYRFLMKFVDLEISDLIWGMFDPTQIMPRDPATIAIDIVGKMNWLVNITDPKQVENFGDETPAEVYSLTLNEVTLAAAGARITGDGDFTFDNSDLETFDGMPAPSGGINLRIVGVNGLLDRLSQMGFLPNDQAMGARMMLGLFARPGDGEDTLTSTIEVKGDGSVFANGQQLK